MKCPMKLADGSRKASQTECEREDCAWWVTIENSDGEDASMCAVALDARMQIANAFAGLASSLV